ncbi:hypothetical protein GCM10007913_11530 [Devosia yakushimensis]|uniref:Transcription factor zinc-finger domain-containing protein n=1 Tax=Devosia yakushimensis TaxID=470028 RepID=A0ABQ5UF77_9HYPH|nr:hypothetical protein [Devosia yakushimensis]GLQ09221.1 hypothetical protein GCM10007913_11530 [Devosia yakushimensis]
MATHYCRCREFDAHDQNDLNEIIFDCCSLCGGRVHRIEPLESQEAVFAPPLEVAVPGTASISAAAYFAALLGEPVPATEQRG